MRRLSFALVAAGAALTVAAARAEEVRRSAWDGVYTEAQAARGRTAYAEHCATCHGPDLAGDGEAKPLTGPEFLRAWDGLTLADLFARMHDTMPQQAPGSLAPEVDADILALLLKTGGLPPGAAELSPQREALGAIRFEAAKPASQATGGPSR